MKVGNKIKTSVGEVILLDVQENYLILFNEKKREFIKATGYKKDNEGKIYWVQGDYYFNFNELIESLN